MPKTKLPAWSVLTIISLVAALLLGATFELTKNTIALRAQEEAAATRSSLVPGAASFEELDANGALTSLFVGSDSNGEPVGYAATTLVSGYGGDIEIAIGMDVKGVISGIRVGGDNFSETPGLGAKAKDAAFTDQFSGLTAPLALHEDIDAITSATITSNAVVRGVNTAAEAVAEAVGLENKNTPIVGRLENGRYYAQVQGFAGPVYVEISLDENNAISDITIGNGAFKETPGYGKKAQEPDFYEQFLGLTTPVVLGTDVDAITGATFTSTAVTDAVNQALAFAHENAE